MELMNTMMEVNTSVNGKTARGMGKALGLGPVEVSTSVHGRMDRKMAKAPSHILMEASTSVNGRTASNMAKAPIHWPMELSTSVNSRTATRGKARYTTRMVMSLPPIERVFGSPSTNVRHL